MLAAACSGVASFFTLKQSWRKSNTEQTDFSRKTLFDDEIADHYFLTLLRLFCDNSFNIVFVLDEMDKVEKDRRDNLLTEIKPFMLAGYASFIAVAGQSLYYKYRQSHTEDDSILSSIFTKNVHVDLLSRHGFHALFDRLVINSNTENDFNKGLQNQFVDSLIFKSKRLPRKFIQLIRENLQWTGDTSFLQIPETDQQSTVYSKMLDIIGSIEENEIAAEPFEAAERDYFVMQLLIDCMSILQNSNAEFALEHFFKNSKKDEDGEDIPVYLDFTKRMEAFVKMFTSHLLNKLEKDKIIEKVYVNGNSYKISKKISVDLPPPISSKEELDQWRLLELQNIVNNVCVNLSFVSQADLGKKKFTDLLKILQGHGAFSLPFLSNEKVSSVLDNLNNLVQDQAATVPIRRILEEHSVQPSELIFRLLEFYCMRKADQVLGVKGYQHVASGTDSGYDYLLTTNNAYYQKLLFQIKLRRGDPLGDRQLFLDNLRLLSKLDTRTFVFLVLFVETSVMQLETIKLRFDGFLDDVSVAEDIRERIQFLPVAINDLKSIENGFNEFNAKHIGRSIHKVFTSQQAPAKFHERNDDEFPELFEFKKDDLTFRITPDDTNFWRFGLRFLRNKTFPSRTEGRHFNKEIADIDICVGDAKVDPNGKHIWTAPHQLALAMHNIVPLDQTVVGYNSYDKGPVKVSLHSNENGSRVAVCVEANGKVIITKEFDLQEYRYCMIAAWCDDESFKLVVDMEVTRKPA